LVAVEVEDHHWVAAVAEVKLFLKQVLLQLERRSFLLRLVVREALEVIPQHKITVRPVVLVVT
jgi:hypothetical protein